jgi:hypothetical protein
MPGAYSAFRLAPNTTGEASGAASRQAPLPEEGPSIPGGAEPLETTISEVESFGQPRANVFGGLPLASLEGPSMASLDLTPSPVPRVSLVHANGAEDVSLVPGPHVIGSRNLPTVAARHVLGPARRVATPAITLPPQSFQSFPPQSFRRSVESWGEGRLARKLRTSMRSSKREIVLGLSIGVGLSVVLAGLGQSYVDNQRSWQARGAVETAKLSALPQPAASAPALADVGEASTGARGFAGLDRAGLDRAGLEAAAPEAVAPASSHGIEEMPALEAKREVRAPKPRGSRDKSPQAPKRATSRRSEASASDSASLPVKTSLSPSESAGLGLDLPL